MAEASRNRGAAASGALPTTVVAVLVGLLIAAAGLVVAPAGALDEMPSPVPSPTSTPTPTPAPTPTPTTGTVVDDAALTWAINDESSNRAFAPGTFNFFSAGRAPDPGAGGRTIRPGDWSQRRGNVSIEKWDGRRWRAATWAGLGTDRSGVPLGPPTAGTFSNHRFAMNGGVGRVDAEAGTARIAWDGDLTVLYYSGMSFFYLSDPVLDVIAGRGTLTATVSGFASSLEDQSQWEPVAPRQVVVADLPSVDLDDVRGFVATPAYRGVKVTGVSQTSGPEAGSFPQGFVDMMGRLGTAAFWHSSGASTDPFKVARPLVVSYDATRTVEGPTVTAQPSPTPVPSPEVTPPPEVVPVPPAAVPPAAVPSAAVPAPAAPPAGRAPAPLAVGAPPTSAAGLLHRPSTLVGASLRHTSAAATGSSSWPWWVGGALLLSAAVVLLVPAGPRRGRATH